MIHDWTIGSRTIYKDEMPERGDIVIFYSDEEQETMVKRVIGLPGETITFVGGHVYVDGERLDESAYLEDSVVTEPGEQDEFVVPDGCIFVLGDNRNNSSDSRHKDLGPIDTRMVVGKAVFLAVPGVTKDLDTREWNRVGLLQ